MIHHTQRLILGAGLAALVAFAVAAAWSPTPADAAPAQASETRCTIGSSDPLVSDTGRQVWKPDSDFRQLVCVFLDVSPQAPVPERAEVISGWAPAFVFDRSLQVTTPSGVRILWGLSETGNAD